MTRQRPRSPRSPAKPVNKRQKLQHPPQPSTKAEDAAYGKTTDPLLVTHPDERHIHMSMSESWKITKNHPMWFIFDAHSPARQFKRGVPFREDQDFPTYGKPPYADLTETDTDDPGLMPFSPCNYKYVSFSCVWLEILTSFRPKYKLQCDITSDQFMSWTKGELRLIEVGVTVIRQKNKKRTREVVYNIRQIPAPYDRILSQLIHEDQHANTDGSHEALRRQTYAQRVLDDFWQEIKKYDGPPVKFRSKVLSPILQRQLFGIEDNYGPAVRNSIAGGPVTPTIAQVTKLYLGDDPADPDWIPVYRRNMVYIPEARWHLGIIQGKYMLGDARPYATIRSHQDYLDQTMRDEADLEDEEMDDVQGSNDGSDNGEPTPPPPLKKAEVQMLMYERLEDFFTAELAQVVGFGISITCCVAITVSSTASLGEQSSK